MRVVAFRTDRIGDVILTLPAIKAIADAGHEVSVVVSPRTRELVEGQPFVREVLGWDDSMPAAELMPWLRRRMFVTAVFFLPRPRLAWAAWSSGIPVRIGTAYRWYSFLFNRRVKVHRSAQERHEAEYNLDLLEPLAIRNVSGVLVAPASIGALPPGLPDRYAVVHPVGGGSALNASPETWGRIAAGIAQSGLPVVLTGGPADRDRLNAAALAGGIPRVRVLAPGSLGVLNAVLAKAAVVVGPSTGPLHLAASLGRPVVGLYSPLRSQHPVRWRPYAPNAVVLTPHEATCTTCLGSSCPIWICVDRVPPERVIAAALAAAT